MNPGDDGATTVDGRRRSGIDPAVPASLRTELVAELAAARALVGSDAEHAVRLRIQDAEVALGERGDLRWENTPDGRRERLAAAMRALLRHRRPDATICPSDAAGSWAVSRGVT